MKNLSLIASALAMLGLTACEKGLVDGVADVAPAGQADEMEFDKQIPYSVVLSKRVSF